MRPGHEGVPGGDQHHGGEGDVSGQEMVELEGGPEREIESSAADGFERVGEGVEALWRKRSDQSTTAVPAMRPARTRPVGPIQWLSMAHLRNRVVAMSRATMPMRLKSWEPMRSSSDEIGLWEMPGDVGGYVCAWLECRHGWWRCGLQGT